MKNMIILAAITAALTACTYTETLETLPVVGDNDPQDITVIAQRADGSVARTDAMPEFRSCYIFTGSDNRVSVDSVAWDGMTAVYRDDALTVGDAVGAWCGASDAIVEDNRAVGIRYETGDGPLWMSRTATVYDDGEVLLPMHDALARLGVRLSNEMPGSELCVASMSLCNIHTQGICWFYGSGRSGWQLDSVVHDIPATWRPGTLAYGRADSLSCDDGWLLIPQTAGWAVTDSVPDSRPHILLQYSIKVDDCYILGSEDSCGDVYVPVSFTLDKGGREVLQVAMSPDAGWLARSGDGWTALFVPIIFDVTVEDWQ